MNQRIVEGVLNRSQGLCELCGSPNMPELHHVLGGNGKRQQHETIESVIVLYYTHHRSMFGVHGKNGHELDLKLKRKLQQTYMEQGYTENEIREKMGGKLY